MDTVQIICSLKNVKSFLGVYPSDLLPHSIHEQTGTVILNTDSHTQEGTLARDPLSTEILHGILFRFIRATTIRTRDSRKPRHVYKRIFHVILQSDTRPRSLGGTRVGLGARTHPLESEI